MALEPGLSSTKTESYDALVLYDGVCHLCCSGVRFVIKRDRWKKIKFASLQSPLGQELLIKYDLSKKNFKTFVFISADQYFTRSTGVLQVLRRLDGAWPGLYGLIVIPKVLRDCFYDWVAGSRYKLFGQRKVCFVPSEDIKSHFLD